jgi:hypothetical protein
MLITKSNKMNFLKSSGYILLHVIISIILETVFIFSLGYIWVFIQERFTSWSNFISPGFKSTFIVIILLTIIAPLATYGFKFLIEFLKPKNGVLLSAICMYLVLTLFTFTRPLLPEEPFSITLTIIKLISIILVVASPIAIYFENRVNTSRL